MSGWLFALLEQASHMFDVMIMWTGLVFPSRLLSLSCIYTHTDDPLISLYIFFFVAVRGVGLVRWFFALFFSSKKEKKPISGLAPSDHTHTHTLRHVPNSHRSCRLLPIRLFFFLLFLLVFFIATTFALELGLGIQFSFSRLPFAHPLFLFLADCWTAAFGPRWVGLGRLPGHV